MPAVRQHILACFVAVVATLSLAACGGGSKTPETVGKRTKGLVPDNVQLITEHKGGVLFMAPWDGTLYIYDPDAGRVVYTTAMRLDERLYFWPARNQILYNGAVVKQGGIDKDHVFRFYFTKGQ